MGEACGQLRCGFKQRNSTSAGVRRSSTASIWSRQLQHRQPESQQAAAHRNTSSRESAKAVRLKPWPSASVTCGQWPGSRVFCVQQGSG